MKNSIQLLLATTVLFFFEIFYFRIAQKYKIVDKPNERSLHDEVIVRGGGIIFALSIFMYFVYSNYQYTFFFLGFLSVTIISFLDDIFTLPNRYRFPFQFLAVCSILAEIDFFLNPFWLCVIIIIMGVGIINAYNFMDGINGITGGYSTIVIGALLFVNNFHLKFIENEFLLFVLSGLIVFNYFNFRTKAKCFAGDVGSISMAVIIFFLLMKLIIKDHNPVYIFFLSVYGVDSVLTIIHRIILRENIFKAHRIHLFQVLVHSLKLPHLVMSIMYMTLQIIICIIIIMNLKNSVDAQLITGFSVVILLSLLYIIIKYKVLSLTV